MKLFACPKYFSEAIALVTNLSCFLGLRIFEYPRGHPRSILSIIYSLFMFSIYYSGTSNMEETFYSNIRLMKLEYVLYNILRYVHVLSVILNMLLGWWHTKKFKACHKKIFEIDETLRQLGLSGSYDSIYFMTIGMIIVWITASFILSTVAFIHLRIRTDICTAVFIILCSTYSLTVNSIYIFEFYLFVRCFRIKFKLINRLLCENLTNLSTNKIRLGIFELKNYAKIMDAEQQKHSFFSTMIFRRRRRLQFRINVSELKKQDQVVSQIESHFPSQFKNQFQSKFKNQSQRYNPLITKCPERKHLLQIIKQVHLELCKVSKIVCTILGVQVAWEIGSIILYLSGAFYNLFIRYVMHQYKVKGFPAQTILTLSMSLLCIFKIVCVSRICKNAVNEGNRTIEIIHAIYGCNADTDMQKEIQQFSIQILQSPITFSVFGLTLDHRVLTTVCIKLLYIKRCYCISDI
ncbi:hypothetical protein ALC57_01720 [Trachymyrmex cornetzi]|uniref:Gustatory receptor n=1 Tax=Trachymyrmex cornetzi TaxID=471704 RepID=A0A195ELE6_9HYME|nr:hypothetical protein ALC57_01720 [Trachymyrmex cornetzi]